MRFVISETAVHCVALGILTGICPEGNSTPKGMSKLFNIWKHCKTVSSPASCCGAEVWKKAARTNLEGGVTSPGIPKKPLPEPNGVSTISPNDFVSALPGKD